MGTDSNMRHCFYFPPQTISQTIHNDIFLANTNDYNTLTKNTSKNITYTSAYREILSINLNSIFITVDIPNLSIIISEKHTAENHEELLPCYIPWYWCVDFCISAIPRAMPDRFDHTVQVKDEKPDKLWQPQTYNFEISPRVPVDFISLVTSHIGLQGEGSETTYPVYSTWASHIPNTMLMGRYHFTQSITIQYKTT